MPKYEVTLRGTLHVEIWQKVEVEVDDDEDQDGEESAKDLALSQAGNQWKNGLVPGTLPCDPNATEDEVEWGEPTVRLVTEERLCCWCREPFTPDEPEDIYCSSRCRDDANGEGQADG